MWAGSVSMGTIDGGTSSSLAQPGVVVQVCTRTCTVRAARAVQSVHVVRTCVTCTCIMYTKVRER